MKKIGLLNIELSKVIAGMGHNDMLVVADAGLPVPPNTQRIDLAVCPGLPSFLDTVNAISQELEVDEILLAEETGQNSPQIEAGLLQIFPNAKETRITHEELKTLCFKSKAVVRTGEFTPYANVILVSGVVF